MFVCVLAGFCNSLFANSFQLPLNFLHFCEAGALDFGHRERLHLLTTLSFAIKFQIAKYVIDNEHVSTVYSLQ